MAAINPVIRAPYPPKPMMVMAEEGPTIEQVRIIGVELAANMNNQGEVELEMFACKHTLPFSYRDYTQARITLHTSMGDVTVRFPFRPGGQYQCG